MRERSGWAVWPETTEGRTRRPSRADSPEIRRKGLAQAAACLQARRLAEESRGGLSIDWCPTARHNDIRSRRRLRRRPMMRSSAARRQDEWKPLASPVPAFPAHFVADQYSEGPPPQGGP